MNLPRSIHQIGRIQYENSKIFQPLRGAHPPLDTPSAHRRARLRATPGDFPNIAPRLVEAGYAPENIRKWK